MHHPRRYLIRLREFSDLLVMILRIAIRRESNDDRGNRDDNRESIRDIGKSWMLSVQENGNGILSFVQLSQNQTCNPIHIFTFQNTYYVSTPSSKSNIIDDIPRINTARHLQTSENSNPLVGRHGTPPARPVNGSYLRFGRA